MSFGGDEIHKFFIHTRRLEEDSYTGAIRMIEGGSKGLRNQTTARFKLFCERPQNRKGYRDVITWPG